MKSAGAAASSASRSVQRSPRRSATQTTTDGTRCELAAAPPRRPGRRRSDLLNTTITGTCRASQFAQQAVLERAPAAAPPSPPRPGPCGRAPAASARTRSSPSAPSSSIPAVSMNSTGPSGSSSIGFSTGSVVVPATSDTIDTCCRVMAFSSDDLPTFRRPKMPMWRRSDLGVGCIVASLSMHNARMQECRSLRHLRALPVILHCLTAPCGRRTRAGTRLPVTWPPRTAPR